MKERYHKTLLALLALVFLSCSNQKPDPIPSITGQITSLTVEGYRLEIFTPESYSTSKQYPVVYFNDGQSLFEGGWRLDELLNQLIETDQIEEIIVVGIYSDGNRTLNYTPYNDAWMSVNWGLTEPLAAEYTADVIEHIIPLIDKQFSTHADKSNRAFMGASLGGLQATWAAVNYPDHFSMIAAFSPSFWVGDYEVFNEDFSKSKDLKIWFDIGTAEWNYYVPLQSKLIAAGYEYGREAFYYEIPGGTHDVGSWKERAQYPFIAFFGKDQDFTPLEMEVHTEVIPSQSRPGNFFLRINPIITTQNGIRYSLAEAATYTLENPEAGTLLADGRFGFSKEEDLRVKVQYNGLEQLHIINFEEVKSLTGG